MSATDDVSKWPELALIAVDPVLREAMRRIALEPASTDLDVRWAAAALLAIKDAEELE